MKPYLSLVVLAQVVALAGACAAPDGSATSESDVEEATSEVRIVEVLSKPAAGSVSFIELRNDSDTPGSLGATLTVDELRGPLEPVAVGGAATARTVLEGHGLALVVDKGVAQETLDRVACEAPIVSSRASLGPTHAAEEDVLVGSIDLARGERRCIPVFVWSGLAGALQTATRLRLDSTTTNLDTVSAAFAEAPLGLALERQSLAGDAFAPSPLGATPGARNFASSDRGELAGGPAPIRVRSASPWRAGIAGRGPKDPLPANLLAIELSALLASSTRSAGAAFYQLNVPSIVDGLVAAKARGEAVELTTDGAFMNDPSYTKGWDALRAASIPLHFDVNTAGKDRGPLSHNKFLVVDDEWLWTGSYNPIEDDPSRVHSDNAVVLRSKALAAVHTTELKTMFGGKYGTLKRGEGVAGGTAFVDGAQVIARFSPGLTDGQAKARALALAKTGDPAAACAATVRGRAVLESRFSGVAPCGGPTDLLYEEVARATSSIYLVQFGLALNDLADLMVERATVGNVEIKGVVDATISTSKLVTQLGAVGDLRATPNSDPDCPAWITPKKNCPVNTNKVWLHHKFLVIDYGTDHPVVITGSHNMSDGAEQQNDETLVVIRDRAVAESYYRIFREIFDHPQALGPKRPKAEAPALGITKVRAGTDPSQPSVIEVASFDARPTSLAGLSLWNRKASFALDAGTTIPARGRVWLVSGEQATLVVPPGVSTVKLPPGFFGPATPLVLQTQDHGWLATFDPYTSATNVRDARGNSPWTAGKALTVRGLDDGALDALTAELLGVNAAPAGTTPQWTARGRFSDWGSGYDVTRAGLALWRSQQALLVPSEL